MKVLKYPSYFFLLAITLLTACTSEVESVDSELLYGHWDIRSAQRDGQPTETLTNTFFEFNKEGKMITNFNLEGNEVSEDFELEGQKIIQKGGSGMSFSIEKLEKEKLIMLTKLMDYQFTLTLEKRN